MSSTKNTDDPLAALSDRDSIHIEKTDRITNREGRLDPVCIPVGYLILDNLGSYNKTVAEALRSTFFRPEHLLSFEPGIFRNLPPWEATALWYYRELTPTHGLELSRKLDDPDFRDELGVCTNVSQSTISRIDSRADGGDGSEPSQYHLNERDRVLRHVHGTDWEELFIEPPEREFETDGAKEPEPRRLARTLRNIVYPYIRLKRNASSTHPKYRLLKLIDIAGTHDVFPRQAATILTGKNWLVDVDTPDEQDLFYHVRGLNRSELTRMFLAANEVLFFLASYYDTFTDPVEVAIDITDWPWYGNTDAKFVSGTKPGRNYAYAWQFITLGIVGSYAPLQLIALPVRKRSNIPEYVRRLLSYAEHIFEIDRVYLDSGFYSAKATAAVLEHDVDFVTKAKMHGDQIKGLVHEAIENDLDWNGSVYGVGDRDPTEHLFVLPAEKKSQRREKEPDDPTDDWAVFYTNLDPETHGAEALAAGYRNRWGVETSFRVLKEDFLPKSGAKSIAPRHFLFNYALMMYNTWVVANLHAAEERDHDLTQSKVVNAATYMAQVCDDSTPLVEKETPDLPNSSNILDRGI